MTSLRATTLSLTFLALLLGLATAGLVEAGLPADRDIELTPGEALVYDDEPDEDLPVFAASDLDPDLHPAEASESPETTPPPPDKAVRGEPAVNGAK